MAQAEKRKRGGKGSVISDPRFARLHTDARFQVFPNKQRKVEIDERFKGVLTDERFQHRASVDKRGRKVKTEKKNEDLARYYRLQDEDGTAAEKPAQVPKTGSKAGAAEKPEKGQKRAAKSAASELQGEGQDQPESAKSSRLNGTKQRQKPAAELALPSQLDEDSELVSESEEEDQPNSTKASGLTVSKQKQKPAPELAPASESDAEEGSESDSEEDDVEDEASKRRARMRGLAGPESSSDDEEGSDDDTDAELPADGDDEEELDLSEWGVGAMAANFDEEVPMMDGEGTRRLALLDMDWEHIRAVDILMVLRSFLAEGQRIERVTVYLSDFGMEQMAAEARLGPQSVFGHQAKPAEIGGGRPGADAELDDEGSDHDSLQDGIAARLGADEDESDAEVDQKRLRLYERSKLRYFFAIVECDEVSTASNLYAQCDGLEFELTANKLDLRFVPEEQSFAERKPRDSATDAPPDYEAPPFFTTAALQHSNVKLTWDATPDERRRALSKKVKAEELRDDDFKAYLGSDSEGDGQDGRVQEVVSIEEYRRRLLSGAGDAGERKGGKDWAPGDDGAQADSSDGEDEARGGAKGENDMDMQVTFDSGLETLGERLASKKGSKAAQTLWEAYEKRRREKRQAAKSMGKHHASSSEDDSDGDARGDEGAGADDDPFFTHEEDPFSDPFFQGGEEKKASKKGERTSADKEARRREKQHRREAVAVEEAEQRKKQAELELLLMDESAPRQVKPSSEADSKKQGKVELSRKERIKLKKEAKRQARKTGSDDEDLAADAPAFKAKLDDARFSAIFNNPAFALDPTDPRFSQSAGAQEVAAAVAVRRQKQRSSALVDPGAAPKDVGAPAAANSKAGKSAGKHSAESAQLRAMVAALKNKGAKTLKQKAQLGKPSRKNGE